MNEDRAKRFKREQIVIYILLGIISVGILLRIIY